MVFHLISRLWHGRLGAESDELLRRFYARASPGGGNQADVVN
ncbi:MAG: hypothetical protein ACLP7J_23180 [Streptosporangiaceae bacterium]